MEKLITIIKIRASNTIIVIFLLDSSKSDREKNYLHMSVRMYAQIYLKEMFVKGEDIYSNNGREQNVKYIYIMKGETEAYVRATIIKTKFVSDFVL
jgi:uncharacterized protein YxeA